MKKNHVNLVSYELINSNTIIYCINNNMNYKKHYDKLMERAKSRILEGYVEKHHIFPKCLGGSDNIENIVILTPEEHFLAHQLLVKMYPKNRDLIYAAQLMTTHHTENRINNKLFGWIRKQCAAVMSIKVKEWHKNNPHPKGMLGKKHNINNIDNITTGIKKYAEEKRISIYAYNLDGSFYKRYSSLIECAKDLKTNASNVKYTAEGKFAYCKGKQLKYEYSERIPPYVKPIHPLTGKKKSNEHIKNLKESIKHRPKRTPEQNAAHSLKMKEYHARNKNK